MKLLYSFYNNNALTVARDLLGKKLVFNNYEGIITETEAYRASDDEASHAYRGVTQRNAVMFGPPGYVYVYIIYGLYYCLNIVTEEAGNASAVLIRGLLMQPSGIHMDGPGKICRYLGITKKENGINLINNNDFYITQGIEIPKIIATPRIGISKAKDKLWRFCVAST